MAYSDKERIAHVYRRLGLGSYPDLIASTETAEDAIDRALDLDHPAPDLLEMEVPLDRETANDIATLAAPVQSWLTSMVQSPRLIEERLVWFWHDHFATAIQKVRIPYLLWRQHLTIREHATGSFDGLLKAIAVDPAMLRYLDGSHNRVGHINENYAREVMELHTLGTDNYSQTDITEAAKALTGWVINVPYARQAQRYLSDYEPWESTVIPDLHYGGTTAFLGHTGSHTLEDVLDILLENPATARFITAKLWAELVGTPPDEKAMAQYAQVFRAPATRLLRWWSRSREIPPSLRMTQSDRKFAPRSSDWSPSPRGWVPVRSTSGSDIRCTAWPTCRSTHPPPLVMRKDESFLARTRWFTPSTCWRPQTSKT